MRTPPSKSPQSASYAQPTRERYSRPNGNERWVANLAACCDRARWLTSGIQGVFPLVVLRFVRGGQNPGRDICPGPVIQGLLL